MGFFADKEMRRYYGKMKCKGKAASGDRIRVRRAIAAGGRKMEKKRLAYCVIIASREDL